jgi:uncharacterized protein YggE
MTPFQVRRALAACVLMCGGSGAWPAARLLAQAPSQPAPGAAVPYISVSASEFVEVAPDRALVTLTVENRGATAAAVGAENATRQAAVLDTLARLGISRSRMRTQGISVTPEYRYPEDGGRPSVAGYQARNSIQVEVQMLATLGSVIDAGLAKGVTNVGGLQFFSSNAADARRDALAKAVERARAEAAAVASAAGGSVGRVLELTANTETPDPRQNSGGLLFRQGLQAAAATETPIEAGLIRVTAFVVVKYAFVR